MTSIHPACGRWSAGLSHLSANAKRRLRRRCRCRRCYRRGPEKSRLEPACCAIILARMKPLHLLGITAALSALLIFAATRADAAPRPAFGPRFPPPPTANLPVFGFPGIYVVDREVIHVVEREVVREVQAPPPPPPQPPRKPWVLGASYASLPGGCMKMIDDGVSYYHCSGEWYRQVGSGSAVEYKAVAAP